MSQDGTLSIANRIGDHHSLVHEGRLLYGCPLAYSTPVPL